MRSASTLFPGPTSLRRLLVGLALLCTACTAPQQRESQPVPAQVSGEGSAFLVDWRHSLGDGIVIGQTDYEESAGARVFSGTGVVVVATRAGLVSARELGNGDERWTVNFPQGVRARPMAWGRDLLIATTRGRIVALDPASGRERWALTLGETLTTPGHIHDDVLYIVSANQTLFAVDLQQERIRWSYRHSAPRDIRLRGESVPTVADGRVHAGFADGTLVALDMEGEVLWVRNLAEDQLRLRDVQGRLIEHRGQVLAASFSGGVHALRAEDGTRVWRQAINGVSDPLLVHGRLVLLRDGGEVLWLSLEEGEVIQALQLPSRKAVGMQILGDYLLVRTIDSGAYLVDARRPFIVQQFDARSGFSAPGAAGADDQLFLLSNRAVFYGLRLILR